MTEDAPLSVDHEAEGGNTDTLAVRVGVQDLLHLGRGLDLRGREGQGGRERVKEREEGKEGEG